MSKCAFSCSPSWFTVFWMPQKKGKPKKAGQKGGKQATINLPPPPRRQRLIVR